MTGAKRVLCAVCRREIPVRRDGRLQAHLRQLGVASPAAIAATESALWRAVDAAEALAPISLILPGAAEGKTA